MDWVDNTCVCGARDTERMFLARDLNFGATKTKGPILKCKSCASVFPEKVPSQETIEAAYRGYYTSDVEDPSRARILRRRFLNSMRREYVARSVSESTSSVLDYGCGTGEYLVHLKSEGSSAKLFGTDLFVVENAQKMGFSFLEKDDLERSGATFDHVTLSHVIEHVPSARETVRRLATLTETGGKVWISTPNSESVLIASYGEYARDIDFPRHIHVFSKKCLCDLLEDGGFKVEFTSPPRINTVLNFLSCIRNVWRDGDQKRITKVRVSLISSIKLFAHLLSKRRTRDATAGEIVALCEKT